MWGEGQGRLPWNPALKELQGSECKGQRVAKKVGDLEEGEGEGPSGMEEEAGGSGGRPGGGRPWGQGRSGSCGRISQVEKGGTT